MSEVIELGLKAPCQKRSIDKMQLVIFAAEHIIMTEGVEEASIPKIAECANVPRSFIYNYFPTKYDLIAHLTEKHFEQVTVYILSALQKNIGQQQDWKQLVKLIINAGAFYFNNHALTTKLVLGAPFSRADIATEEKKVSELAQQLRQILAQLANPLVLPETPNIAGFAVEIVLAIMRFSYFNAGAISPDAVSESNHALVAYLQRWQCASETVFERASGQS
ncbi:MAG: TetR/AcrR family transcriptional regulator [Moraxellaceae bacterium]|nr:TetR/AcrR family transcriptional regulator [Moraxellaceae bacterium]MDZ4297636.1 TetR/AcrR family transcriptional regulator [Moraxellaceae bacterium]MDZ4385909.1 TetR/AcrR family transcriptional regulator [Moraxellaceae bacterium]